jgi:hypothetical protein
VEGMEGLAYLIVFFFMLIVLGGPVAILLTLIKTKNTFLTVLRRIILGIVLLLSVGASLDIFMKLPPLGVFGLSMAYIALAREYFPQRKFFATLFGKFTGRG